MQAKCPGQRSLLSITLWGPDHQDSGPARRCPPGPSLSQVDYAAASSPTSCPCPPTVVRAHEGTVRVVWWTVWKRMNCNTCPGGKGTRSQPLPKLPGRFRSSSPTRTKPGPALQAALPPCASWEKVFIMKGISYLSLSFKARSRSHLPRKPLLTSLGSASGLHTHVVLSSLRPGAWRGQVPSTQHRPGM